MSNTDFGSLDSSDTFLSCNTHPFPSQGSLAGLEALAAQGSMAPNGSINNTLYVNPFDPGKGGIRRGSNAYHNRQPKSGSNHISNNNNNNGSVSNGNSNGYCTMSPSPKGSPQRRVRIAARSRSSDLSDFDLMERETGIEDIQPKHLRSRLSQGRGVRALLHQSSL